MRKIKLGFMSLALLIIASCTKPMDKSLNSEDFETIKEVVTTMKSKYIIDNLTEQLVFLELGKKMGKAIGQDMDETKISTFREEIAKLKVEFDSIHFAKIEIAENNKKLENFVTLVNASTTSIDR